MKPHIPPLIAALLTRAFKVTYYTGGEGTPYPYRWCNKKGVMTLEIDSSAADVEKILEVTGFTRLFKFI